jgi:periplasmic divalent cation tolerance protein
MRLCRTRWVSSRSARLPRRKEAAVDLARRAVEAKLAAGAQVIGPVTSVFWHLGEFGTGEEWQLLLQTHRSRYTELQTLLLEHHPWDNPELVAVPIVEAAPACLDWIRRSVEADS